MIRTDRKFRLCTVLLIANLAVIWGNSLIPGEISGQISGFVAQLIEKLMGMSEGQNEGGHGLLRKLAHFSEFACLGALLVWRFSMGKLSGRPLITQTLLCGILAACVDETIQIFVDGRASSLIDVWIDTCGTAAGMALLHFGHHLIKNKTNHKILEETK